jgi:hypothetical protein
MQLWQALRPAMKSTLETNRRRGAASVGARRRPGAERRPGDTASHRDGKLVVDLAVQKSSIKRVLMFRIPFHPDAINRLLATGFRLDGRRLVGRAPALVER